MTIKDLLKGEVSDSLLAANDLQVFTSLNRYERKKGIDLAILAFAQYLQANEARKKNCVLVVAGGWDPRVTENIEVERELKQTATELGIIDNVAFLKSISNDHRLLLLESTQALLYTPQNEHFGIVPVEAMHMGCIVLACNSGGPLESIAHGETGFLLEPRATAWSACLGELENVDKERMRRAAKDRVKRMFTNEAFADKLHEILQRM